MNPGLHLSVRAVPHGARHSPAQELTLSGGCPTIEPRPLDRRPAALEAAEQWMSEGEGNIDVGAREAVPALRVAMFYDMDACHDPTGVTRHALAQLAGLHSRPEVDFRLLAGRMSHPDGLAFWESLGSLA